MRRFVPLLFPCLWLLASCTSGVGLAAPRAMNHPIDVAFACFDTSMPGNPVVAPLASCALFVDVTTNTRTTPLNPAFHMHALVTQSTRGEVGAVDLIARGVLDSDQSVPGYTFVPVGELPTTIVVRPSDSNAGGLPACTYVASRGPVDGRHPGISIIDTRRFRSGAGLDHNPFATHAPYVLPSAPSDMVLAPDEQSLWVTLDDLSVLVRIPIISSCEFGAIDLVVPLFEEPVPSGVPYVDGASADLTYQCGLPEGVLPVTPQIGPPRTPDFDAFADPQPVAITIDTDNGVILVADRALPVIHRVNLADGTLLSPIATGAPIRDVVVTPRVPDSYEFVADPLIGTCSMENPLHSAGSVVPVPGVHFSRYLYAIDDSDGTVMAIEYTDPTDTAHFGAVIPVDVRGARRPDRIAMPVVARTLEIVTPQYDTTSADPRFPPPGLDMCTPDPAGNRSGFGLCLPSEDAATAPPSPQVLRGVFLVVAAADGSVRFVDVYDLDAPCRGRAFGGVGVTFGANGASGQCQSPTVNGDTAVYIRRHRPRVQQLLTTFVTIDTGPTVFLPAGGNFVLGTNGAPANQGTTDMGNIPSLAPLGTCPAPLGQVWGELGEGTEPDAPVVCSLVDPFAAIPETWSATFEGAIPGTYTSSGNAHTPGGVFDGNIDTRIDYCARGVIGQLDAETNTLDPGDPERAYHGDMLLITGTIPDAMIEGDPICRAVLSINQIGEQQQPILVPITQAFTNPSGAPTLQQPYLGRLFIPPTTPLENRDAFSPRPTISDVVHCFGDTLLTVEVRSRNAFTVSGTRSGFQTRVVRRDTDGACTWDADPSRILAQGRAFNNVLFHNARIAFQPINTPVRTLANELAEIRMVLTGGPSQLGLDLSLSSSGTRSMALPSGLRYSPEMWALYAIETERRGLVEMTLRPVAVTNTAYQ